MFGDSLGHLFLILETSFFGNNVLLCPFLSCPVVEPAFDISIYGLEVPAVWRRTGQTEHKIVRGSRNARRNGQGQSTSLSKPGLGIG